MYTASSARCSTLPYHFGDTAALNNTRFTDEELDAIDRHAVEGGINLWKGPSRA